MRKYGKMAVVLLLFFVYMVTFQAKAEPDEQEAVAKRMEKAASLGLTEWVDEEGFLIDDFFAGKSDAEISSMGLDGLVRVMTDEEVEAFMQHLKAGIDMYSVTYYKKVSQVNPDTGGTLYTGMFKVDGKLAFCIERSVATPAQGSPTGTKQAVTNTNLRKVLYYGYNGPKDAGYTYVETALAAGEANGDGDNSLGRKILAEIKTKSTPPSTFQVWKVTTNGGKTQDLAYYTVVENGYGRVQKVSAKPGFTDGNPYYSVEGAVYKVYKEKTCQTVLKTLTVGANGYSNKVTLAPGTYYVKETTSPERYQLDKTVYTMTVKSSTTTTVTVKDKPIMYVKLTKYRENSQIKLPDAVFQLTRPDGTAEELATDSEGNIVWENLQSGSYEIREITAPQGYRKNLNVVAFEIDDTGTIRITSEHDAAYGDIRTGFLEDGNLYVEVEDRLGYRFPETGAREGIVLLCTGSGICLAVIFIQKKKRRLT